MRTAKCIFLRPASWNLYTIIAGFPIKVCSTKETNKINKYKSIYRGRCENTAAGQLPSLHCFFSLSLPAV